MTLESHHLLLQVLCSVPDVNAALREAAQFPRRFYFESLCNESALLRCCARGQM